MLQCFVGRAYLLAAALFVTLTGIHAECPLKIMPPRLVVRYGDSAAADCIALVNHNGMGWESTVGAVSLSPRKLITWTAQDLKDWDIQPPICLINNENTQCNVELLITIYKTPDSVSIRNKNRIIKEGSKYKLECDIYDVAPVQNLIVNWYKGETLVNQASFTDTIKSPVNKTATLLILPDRHDDGAQYRCEAELKLGEDGPQPPPKVTSDPFRIEVIYKPKHSSPIEFINQTYEVSLNCTVMANPAAEYTWHSKQLKEKKNFSVLQSSTLSAGNYTCTATNSLGQDIKVFIVRSAGRTTFWAIVISGVGLAVVLILAYIGFKIWSPPNTII